MTKQYWLSSRTLRFKDGKEYHRGVVELTDEDAKLAGKCVKPYVAPPPNVEGKDEKKGNRYFPTEEKKPQAKDI